MEKKKGKLTPREKRYQKSQEFKDWSKKFYHKDLTDPKKFKVTYSDEFVNSVDATILISKEYIVIKRKKSQISQEKQIIEENIQEEIEEFIEQDLKNMIVFPLTLILNIKISGSDGCYEVEFTLRYSNKFSLVFNDEYQNISQEFENCIRNTFALVRGVKDTIGSSWVTKYQRIFGCPTDSKAKVIVKEDIAMYIKYLNGLLKKAKKDHFFECKGNIEVIGEGEHKTYESKICSSYPQFLFIPK